MTLLWIHLYMIWLDLNRLNNVGSGIFAVRGAVRNIRISSNMIPIHVDLNIIAHQRDTVYSAQSPMLLRGNVIQSLVKDVLFRAGGGITPSKKIPSGVPTLFFSLI